MDWRVPEFERWMARLGTRWRVTRFDARGHGLSEHVNDLATREALRADTSAVLDATSTEPSLLFSVGGSATSSALLLAHDLGERWSSVAMWGATFFEGGGPALFNALLAVEQLDQDVFNRTYFMWRGWEEAESRRRRVEAYVASGRPANRSPEGVEKIREAAARNILPQLRVPILLLSREDTLFDPGARGGLELAQQLPRGTRRTFPGTASDPELGDTEAVARALEEFDEERLAGVLDETGSEPIQTILFTDLESSTALTQRLGDEGAQELLRGHNDAVRSALEAHDGREVKHTGDGIMASFPSAVSAVQAALAMQRDLAGAEVRVRIGLNAGEPIAEDDDFFGTAVQLAARITDRAEPGQVLVSNVVRELCAGKGFEFTSVGDATLKGFDEPVMLFEVRAGSVA